MAVVEKVELEESMADEQVRIMGILNVTPDSFSDGGRFVRPKELEAQVRRLLAEGADIIDVGGESSRPFAEPVAEEEELARVLPAIAAIRGCSSTIPVSIDTTKARVARAALAAGATMVNDISALQHDPAMVEVVQAYQGPVIIMHMQGDPATMQLSPSYGDLISEINAFFSERLAWLEQQGIKRERVILDPGVGFGKTLDHNLAILSHIQSFTTHGCPLLIGHSRKSFFNTLFELSPLERDLPTAVVSALCALQGVDILRVHAVKENRQAVALARVCGGAATP